MIRLNCFVRLNDAALRDEVTAHAKALVAATLANDKGCVAYDFFASATHDNLFMFCETWADEASLEAHSNAPHFKEHVGANRESRRDEAREDDAMTSATATERHG